MSRARRDLCGGRPEPHWPSGLTGEGPFLPRPHPTHRRQPGDRLGPRVVRDQLSVLQHLQIGEEIGELALRQQEGGVAGLEAQRALALGEGLVEQQSPGPEGRLEHRCERSKQKAKDQDCAKSLRSKRDSQTRLQVALDRAQGSVLGPAGGPELGRNCGALTPIDT